METNAQTCDNDNDDNKQILLPMGSDSLLASARVFESFAFNEMIATQPFSTFRPLLNKTTGDIMKLQIFCQPKPWLGTDNYGFEYGSLVFGSPNVK